MCVLPGPANEENEMDTLLILGQVCVLVLLNSPKQLFQFGNGPEGSVWPVRISTIGKVM